MPTTFNPIDPLQFEAQLSQDECDVMYKAREFAATYLKPIVTDAFRNEGFDLSLIQEIGKHGFFDMDSAVKTGLVAREFERVDSGFRTVLSVIGCLVKYAISYFGNEEQKQTYLPKLIAGQCIACFGLTEPEHGSDPHQMQTVATQTAAGYRLTGVKSWIGLSPSAELFVIWAKDEAGIVRGFLVDGSAKNLSVKTIEGKFSLRVVPSGEVRLDGVEVPESAMLPNASGLKSVFKCLNHARFGIGWGALGAAEACYTRALNYIKQRNDFAEKQLVQQKLANMCIEISLALQACLRVSRLLGEGSACPEQISILKRNSAAKALAIARDARDIMGGNGIVDSYDVIRHMLNLESVNTYEGTADIHTLILGKAITGVNAL